MKFGYAWTSVNKPRGETPAPPPVERAPAVPRRQACRGVRMGPRPNWLVSACWEATKFGSDVLNGPLSTHRRSSVAPFLCSPLGTPAPRLLNHPPPPLAEPIMARSWPSLGLFGVFGRSGDLRALDDALRAAGMHPALAPEAVKIAALNLLKEARGEQRRRRITAMRRRCSAIARLGRWCMPRPMAIPRRWRPGGGSRRRLRRARGSMRA